MRRALALAGVLLASALMAAAAPAVAPAAVWDGFKPPAAGYAGAVVTENVPIEMADGTVLRADVTRPALADGTAAPGRFPVVVEQTCYGKGVFRSSGARYAEHGFVHVLVDVRGTGDSEGEFMALDGRERLDGREIVGWAARQDWSTGKVGVTGFSYMGAAANRTVETRPKALKAAFVGGSPTDIYREFMTEGGVWSNAAVLWNRLANAGSQFADSFRQRAYEGMEHGGLNWQLPLWSERTVDVSRYEVPTFVYTGWLDLFFRSSPRQYREMDLQAGRKQLLIGPWTHYSPKPVGPDGSSSIEDIELAWFDRWLKGKRNGITELGPVTLFDQGLERWRRYGDWPAPDVRYKRFYLSGKVSDSAVSINDGSLSRVIPRASGVDSGLNDPRAGACSRSTIQFSGGTIPPSDPCNQDQRPEEDTALTYTTPPLRRDLHLDGPLALTLLGKSSAKDPLWVARVSDVQADGTSVPVTQGSLLASRRKLDREESRMAPNGDVVEPVYEMTRRDALPTKPGEPVRMHVEILATNWTIEKGHRLRLTIQGADTSHFQESDTTWRQRGTSSLVRRMKAPSYLTVAVDAGR